MRWTAGDRGNIDDERGASGGGRGAMIPLGIGGFIVVALLSMFTGVDFFSILGGGGGSGSPQPTAVGTAGKVTASPAEEKVVDMVDAIARDVQQMWSENLGSRYRPTKVTLFRDSIQSACGYAGAVSGPFYCPGDEKVYLDLSFFDELKRRFGASGDFAEAYVLAHEFGHHIQKLSGTEAQVREQQQADPRSVNALSVRLELQADCYAGRVGPRGLEAGARGQGRGRARSRRSRGRPARRRRDWRRSPAEARHWTRDAGEIHARHFGAARHLVQARLRRGRSQAVRHLQQRGYTLR